MYILIDDVKVKQQSLKYCKSKISEFEKGYLQCLVDITRHKFTVEEEE